MSMIQEKTIPVFCYFSCLDLHFGCPAADSEFETWKRMISIEILTPFFAVIYGEVQPFLSFWAWFDAADSSHHTVLK